MPRLTILLRSYVGKRYDAIKVLLLCLTVTTRPQRLIIDSRMPYVCTEDVILLVNYRRGSPSHTVGREEGLIYCVIIIPHNTPRLEFERSG